jgi:hypothetical protein
MTIELCMRSMAGYSRMVTGAAMSMRDSVIHTITEDLL